MADISSRITKKSLKAKRKAAIKTIKTQAKEKIHDIKIQYAANPKLLQAKAIEREQKKALRLQKQNARLAYNSRRPNQYTLGEDIFNSISHGIGAGLSVAAIVVLVLVAYFNAPIEMRSLYVASFAIFASSLFLVYIFSTLYHVITPHGARKVFSIFNHIGIYLVIAGTYTPFVVTHIKGTLEYLIISLIWGVCIALSTLYAVFGARLKNFSIFTYAVLGGIFILVLGLIDPADKISSISQLFIILGGISYAVGGLFYFLRNYKWTHSICHLFCLSGSILHFFAVLFLV